MSPELTQILESALRQAREEKVELIAFTFEKGAGEVIQEITWRNVLPDKRDVVKFMRLMASLMEKRAADTPARVLQQAN